MADPLAPTSGEHCSACGKGSLWRSFYVLSPHGLGRRYCPECYGSGAGLPPKRTDDPQHTREGELAHRLAAGPTKAIKELLIRAELTEARVKELEEAKAIGTIEFAKEITRTKAAEAKLARCTNLLRGAYPPHGSMADWEKAIQAALDDTPAPVEPGEMSRKIHDAMERSRPLVADALRLGRESTRVPGTIGAEAPNGRCRVAGCDRPVSVVSLGSLCPVHDVEATPWPDGDLPSSFLAADEPFGVDTSAPAEPPKFTGPSPSVVLSEDGDRLALTWTNAGHVASLTFPADQSEWFYRDRAANKAEGTEDEYGVPQRFFDLLKMMHGEPIDPPKLIEPVVLLGGAKRALEAVDQVEPTKFTGLSPLFPTVDPFPLPKLRIIDDVRYWHDAEVDERIQKARVEALGACLDECETECEVSADRGWSEQWSCGVHGVTFRGKKRPNLCPAGNEVRRIGEAIQALKSGGA